MTTEVLSHSIKRKRGRPRRYKVNDDRCSVIPVLPKSIPTDSMLLSHLLHPSSAILRNEPSDQLIKNKTPAHNNAIQTMFTTLVKQDGQHRADTTEKAWDNESASKDIEAPLQNTTKNKTKQNKDAILESVHDSEISKSKRKRNKGNHNAEEKRRKEKISSWIWKLGALLCKFPSEKQSKILILERAVKYIKEASKAPIMEVNKDCEKLLSRINQLESVIMLLVELLQRNSVNIPEHVKISNSSSPESVNNECVLTAPPAIVNVPTQMKVAEPKSASVHTSVILLEGTNHNLEIENNSVKRCVHSASASTSSVVSSNLITTSRSVTNSNREHLNMEVLSACDKLSKSFCDSRSGSSLMLSPLKPSPSKQSAALPLLNNTSPMQVVCVTPILPYASILPPNLVAVIPVKSSAANTIVSDAPDFTASSISKTLVTSDISHKQQNGIVALNSKNSIKSTNEKSHFINLTNENDSQCSSFEDVNVALLPRSNIKSPVQNFGIDKLLVSSIACSVNFSLSVSTCVTSSDTISQSVGKNKLVRTGSSSGSHTVAALLETNSSFSECEAKFKRDVNNVDAQKYCFANTTSSTVQLDSSVKNNALSSDSDVFNTVSSSSSVPNKLLDKINKTTAISNSKGTDRICTSVTSTSKRWSKLVEDAHNSNMLLTSFIMENKSTKVKNHKKIVSDCNQKFLNFNNELNKSNNQDNKFNKQLCCGKQCNKAVAIATTTVLSQPGNPVHIINQNKNVQPCPAKQTQLHININNSDSPCKTVCKQSQKPVSVLCRHVPNTNVIYVNTSSTDVSTVQSKTVMNVGTVKPKTAMDIGAIQSNSSQNFNLKDNNTTTMPLRTMKDRTIKNKWLATEKKTKLLTNACCIATTNVAMATGVPVEQCASPVISFSRGGSRKRKSDYMQNVQEPNLDNSNTNEAVNSSSFSAESLCKSADRKQTNRTHVKTFQKNLSSKLQRNQQRQMKLNHQPEVTYASSLPTILNIFAPAPVPVTSTMQQPNLQTDTLVNNECNIGMIENNIHDSNFTDNMLLAANPQLFTNFSADTLISDNDSAMPFAIDNLISQNNPNHLPHYWNQPWLPQDMALNDPIFQGMTNIQNNVHRQRNNVSTECSPIKSIMSILQSNTTNNQTFEDLANNINPNLPNNNFIPHHGNQLMLRHRRNNQIVSHGLPMNIPNMWNRSLLNNNMERVLPGNNIDKDIPGNVMLPQWNHNRSLNRQGIQVENVNYENSMQLQNIGSKPEARVVRDKPGPTFGNYPLVHSSLS